LHYTIYSSVADPGCLSRNQKQQQKRGGKQFFVLPFFVATKITKLKIYINVELVKTKILANLRRMLELSTPKLVIKPEVGEWSD
jgi:hypothetical protein